MKPIPVPAVVKWYRARDVFLGLNGNAMPNYRYGLELAQECKAEPGCEEAAWFCGLCEAIDSPFVLDDDDSDDAEYLNNPHLDIPRHAISVFFNSFLATPGVAHTKEGGRLMGLCALLLLQADGGGHVFRHTDIWALLTTAASAGYPLAMCHLAEMLINRDSAEYDPDVSRTWALRAAELGEPHGMWLAHMHDCNAQPWLKRAAELGYHKAESRYAEQFDIMDPRYFYWKIRAAVAAINNSEFFDSVLMAAHTRPHNFFTRSMFQIGSSFAAAKREGNPDPQCPLDYPIDMCYVLNCSVPPAIDAVFRAICHHYSECCKGARLAVDTWTLMAMRRRGPLFRRLCADMRRMIAERIWDCRVEWHEWEGP